MIRRKPERRFLYVHIYKCGGSSMREHIERHLVDPGTEYIDHWAYHWEQDFPTEDRLIGNLMRSEELRFGPLRLPQGPVVVSTHCFFYQWMAQLPGFSLATMLRDPISRVVSQFEFERRTFGKHEDSSVIDFIEGLASFDVNLQVAALCGSPHLDIGPIDVEAAKSNLHSFDFVGFVDDFETSLQLFNRIYGIDSSEAAPRVNVNPKPPPQLPDWLLAALHERCAPDLELVRYARQLFRAKTAALELLESESRDDAPPSLRHTPTET